MVIVKNKNTIMSHSDCFNFISARYERSVRGMRILREIVSQLELFIGLYFLNYRYQICSKHYLVM